MMTVLTIAGLAIAVIVFLNMLQAKDNVNNLGAKKEPEGPKEPPRVNARRWMEHATKPGELRPRICPLCGTVLSQEDYLIAAIGEDHGVGKRQAHIYGCRFCFASDGVNTRVGELTRMEP